MSAKNVKANYAEYCDITDKLFDGVVVSGEQMNKATDRLRKYLVDGGAGEIVNALCIGVKEVTRESLLYPRELVSRRFVYISGPASGRELRPHEIEAIGVFLPDGPYYGLFGLPVIDGYKPKD